MLSLIAGKTMGGFFEYLTLSRKDSSLMPGEQRLTSPPASSSYPSRDAPRSHSGQPQISHEG